MEPLHWTRVVYSNTSDILHSLSSQAQSSSILPILPTAVIIITFYLYHIYITRRPDATKKWSTVAISRLKLLNSHFPGRAGNELISTLPSLSLRCNVSSYVFFKIKAFSLANVQMSSFLYFHVFWHLLQENTMPVPQSRINLMYFVFQQWGITYIRRYVGHTPVCLFPWLLQ